MTENKLQSKILKLASSLGLRLFRNHTGRGFLGKPVARTVSYEQLRHIVNDRLSPVSHSSRFTLLENPRETVFGLCVGSSDTIGIFPKTIMQSDVGKKIGVFCAVELKSEKGKATKEQSSFIEMVRSLGGIGFLTRSLKEFEEVIHGIKT